MSAPVIISADASASRPLLADENAAENGADSEPAAGKTGALARCTGPIAPHSTTAAATAAFRTSQPPRHTAPHPRHAADAQTGITKSDTLMGFFDVAEVLSAFIAAASTALRAAPPDFESRRDALAVRASLCLGPHAASSSPDAAAAATVAAAAAGRGSGWSWRPAPCSASWATTPRCSTKRT